MAKVLLRGVAIIGVVIIHTVLYDEYSTGNNLLFSFYLTIVQVSTFSVPLFIFISGLVMTYNYSDVNINYKDFIKNRLNVILIPYLIWSVIYLLYRITFGGENINLITAIKKIIIGNAQFHLYFIVLIMQFYLLFPFIVKFILKLKKYHLHLLTLVFIFNLLIISIYYYQFNYLKERYIMTIFIFWIFYFVLGSVISLNLDYYKNVLSKISPTFISILFFIDFEYLDISYFYNRFLTRIPIWLQPQVLRPQVLLYATLFIIIIFKFVNELKLEGLMRLPAWFLEKLGKNSFGIYLSHILILDVSIIVFKLLKINNHVFYYNIILFLLILTTSLSFVIIVKRLPLGSFVVGK